MSNMRTFCCKDCGMDCSFMTTGMDERQVSQKVIEHMHAAHGMKAIPAETLIKIYYTLSKNS